LRVGAGKLSRARPATRPGQAAPESGLVPPHGLPSAKFVPQSTEIGTPTVGANPTASWRAMATLTHVDRSEGLAPGEGCQQVAEEGPSRSPPPGKPGPPASACREQVWRPAGHPPTGGDDRAGTQPGPAATGPGRLRRRSRPSAGAGGADPLAAKGAAEGRARGPPRRPPAGRDPSPPPPGQPRPTAGSPGRGSTPGCWARRGFPVQGQAPGALRRDLGRGPATVARPDRLGEGHRDGSRWGLRYGPQSVEADRCLARSKTCHRGGGIQAIGWAER